MGIIAGKNTTTHILYTVSEFGAHVRARARGSLRSAVVQKRAEATGVHRGCVGTHTGVRVARPAPAELGACVRAGACVGGTETCQRSLRARCHASGFYDALRHSFPALRALPRRRRRVVRRNGQRRFGRGRRCTPWRFSIVHPCRDASASPRARPQAGTLVVFGCNIRFSASICNAQFCSITLY
eukprot:COSAG02_NODE_107_length_36312_cov_45.037942_1_plen_183_part_10